MSSTAIGDALEERIYALFECLIETDQLLFKKSCCRLFRKKGYYSKDRQKDIVFDLAIELYHPGASFYSMLFLIECKNYKHSVPVDDAEEFFAKVQQVGAANTKAIIASTGAFQSGAKAYSKSKGIGLLRYFDREEFKWELYRSASSTSFFGDDFSSDFVEDGLSNPDFKSDFFDFYLQSPKRKTNSLWDFLDDFSIDVFDPSEKQKIYNVRSRPSSQVPFIEKTELEALAEKTLHLNDQTSGEVSLEAICLNEARRCNLVVTEEATLAITDSNTEPPLGRISFAPLHIHIYFDNIRHRGRERFTLAHELAHHFLDHQRFMAGEYCVDSDFTLQQKQISGGSDVARMEFQANYFAASLLMPRSRFAADFNRIVNALGLTNKGFGALYVDDQPCNLKNLDLVSTCLMQMYGVSRTAAKIRLEGIGLLNDARKSKSFHDIQSVLASAYNAFD